MNRNTECQYNTDEVCEKNIGRYRCLPSTRSWLKEVIRDRTAEFISVSQICEKTEHANDICIGLTKRDLRRLDKGDVIFIRREGRGNINIFIGSVDADD